MSYVYLIKEDDENGRYKIGSTRKKNIEERLKELQTGNPSKLIIADSFETEKPFKLEGMLHRHYANDNELNEWFNLDEDKIKGFKDVCKKYQTIIESLNNNPFF